jgi:hypothetical protein
VEVAAQGLADDMNCSDWMPQWADEVATKIKVRGVRKKVE